MGKPRQTKNLLGFVSPLYDHLLSDMIHYRVSEDGLLLQKKSERGICNWLKLIYPLAVARTNSDARC